MPISSVGQLERHLLETIIQGLTLHPHLVRAVDVVITQLHYVLILEWCEQGNLASQIEIMPTLGARTQRFMLEIAMGLFHLHTRMGVVHRDLKPDNILFQNDHALITDYGLARIMGPNDYVSTNGRGAQAYMAPEMQFSNNCNGMTDIYSLGIIFLEMLTGKLVMQLLPGFMIPCSRPDFPSTQLLAMLPNDNARALISSMLQRDPSRRAGIGPVVDYLQENDVVSKQQPRPSN